ncbi:dTMP kinase [Tomitella gaofuii]|uniref:dTMP kinase n=1 Tax=Tomitella gaofuii TaxID=2760083 RepID=UPI0015F9DE06|nr:dTMP kinase [Tomitella gaofuii]
MGVLIAVEGIDGAGKRTLTGRLVDAWRREGLTVATAAFPRYGASVHADLGAEALHGGHGDLVDSVYGMALMWALDRRAAGDDLAGMIAGHDVVLLDRYVASNAAYGAARLREGCEGPFTEWVRGLEFGRFGLPVPDAQLLLDVPVELARERAAQREAQDPSRSRDAYERDDSLQARVAAAYEALADAAWVSQWESVPPDAAGSADAVDALAARIAHAG